MSRQENNLPLIPEALHDKVAAAFLKASAAVSVAQATPSLAHIPGPDCCAAKPVVQAFPIPSGRAKLWNLTSQLHCPVLGTCLTTQELRKLVARCTQEPVDPLSDLDVHEQGVLLAATADGSGRILHKALDQRHQVAIRRFDKAKTTDAIVSLWEEAKRNGDIPGAYWAALTHRTATRELRTIVFGEVHMLSHLVGAANRADIRRLALLDRHNAELMQTVERQQVKLRDAVVSREETIRRLNEQLAERIARHDVSSCDAHALAETEVQTLRELVGSLQRRLVNESGRREKAESRGKAADTTLAEIQASLRNALSVQGEMRAELEAAEAQLSASHGTDSKATDILGTAVRARTVLYVGGRPGQIQAIRNLVEQADGEFIYHDGGLENRKGLLAGEVSKADFVFFPVDCISHDAVVSLKRLCS